MSGPLKKFSPSNMNLDPKHLLQTFRKWIRFHGGVMDTYLPVNSKKTRHEVGSTRFDQWAWRSPAPGSAPSPKIPYRDLRKVYDIKYYDRDTRMNEAPLSTDKPDFAVLEAEQRKLLAAKKEAGDDAVEEAPAPIGSPGNKNPAVLRYDPSGLRSAMSATHEAMNKSLEEHMSTQVPLPEWAEEAGDVITSYEKHGLPPTPGRPLQVQQNSWRHDTRW